MNQRALIIAAAIFALVIGLMFGYAYMKKQELVEQQAPVVPVVDEQAESVRINAVHFIASGTHTVLGEVMMPTPCDLLESSAVVRESMPEQAAIMLTTVNNTETCAQVVTMQRFRVSFEASEQATVTATLDGKPVILNMKAAEAGETPEDIGDLYFKG